MDAKPVVQSRGLVLENYDDNRTHYGYLRVTVPAEQLRIAFQTTDEDIAQARADVVVDGGFQGVFPGHSAGASLKLRRLCPDV